MALHEHVEAHNEQNIWFTQRDLDEPDLMGFTVMDAEGRQVILGLTRTEMAELLRSTVHAFSYMAEQYYQPSFNPPPEPEPVKYERTTTKWEDHG